MCIFKNKLFVIQTPNFRVKYMIWIHCYINSFIHSFDRSYLYKVASIIFIVIVSMTGFRSRLNRHFIIIIFSCLLFLLMLILSFSQFLILISDNILHFIGYWRFIFVFVFDFLCRYLLFNAIICMNWKLRWIPTWEQWQWMCCAWI